MNKFCLKIQIIISTNCREQFIESNQKIKVGIKEN